MNALAVIDAEFEVIPAPGNAVAVLKWFEFDQNNSGGIFEYDRNLSEKVFIQAVDLLHAIGIAESIGIYFNGCASGIDCPCCGDRWYEPWDEGTVELPKLWCWEAGRIEVDLDDYISSHCPEEDRPIRLHYLNGEVHSAGMPYEEAQSKGLVRRA